MAFRMRDEPDCKGRCACSQTASHSAIASITGRRKSFGWGLVNRMRSMPSTRSHARSSSPKSVWISGARSRPHELTFWPRSVSSRTPSPASRVTSATTSPARRLRVTPSDGDDFVRVASLDRCGLREMRCELLIGLLANRARVEDENVSLVLRRRLAETELLEHALDPLAVVSVHLAAEGRHVVPAHGPEWYPWSFPTRPPCGSSGLPLWRYLRFRGRPSSTSS